MNNLDLKMGWVHLLVLKNGTVVEGHVVGVIRGIMICRPLLFSCVNGCPHCLFANEVDFSIPVLKLENFTTECDYNDALALLSKP